MDIMNFKARVIIHQKNFTEDILIYTGNLSRHILHSTVIEVMGNCRHKPQAIHFHGIDAKGYQLLALDKFAWNGDRVIHDRGWISTGRFTF